MYFFSNLLGISAGIIIPYFLRYRGVLIGNSGIEYYGEVHTTFLNSLVHTIFMPFTTYGILLWFPRIFTLSYIQGIKLQQFLYTMYMTHYIVLNPCLGSIITLFYFPSIYNANKDYEIEIHYPFIAGLSITIISLTIQEVFGHWLSGDPPSRIDAVPNAIMYSMYYSVSHLFS
tara:strand:- start:244 stop:762 length:519 start_codon:yes stop_codon:yes gene_type:complete